MKIKTSELIDAALRWAVATLEGYTNLRRGVFSGELVMDPPRKEYGAVEFSSICYDTDWSQGGPIIEREIAKIERFSDALWEATAFTKNAQDFVQNGPNPLVAAMRCYCSAKLGDEIDVPEELCQQQSS